MMAHHRNILYTLVFIVLVFNLISFVTLSSQVSRTHSDLLNTKAALANTSRSLFALMQAYEEQNQRNFNDITVNLNDLSKSVSKQQVTFEQEIKLLKSTQGDFSDVIDSAVRGVVTVRTDKSMGTGFIVDSRGYIATNYHVISDAERLYVVTYDRKMIPAQILGFDAFRDVALLKIEGNYNNLALSNSSSLEVGNKVIAIGNPLGLSFSVTEGIVSALHRTGPNGLQEYIQTDVSLNPGNSGGPLIDTQGNVIGINNFKVGDAENLGFALESNSLSNIINSLANKTIISNNGA